MIRMRSFVALLALVACAALASPAAAILDADKTTFTSFTIPNDTSGNPVRV